jgi:hypothetical protein
MPKPDKPLTDAQVLVTVGKLQRILLAAVPKKYHRRVHVEIDNLLAELFATEPKRKPRNEVTQWRRSKRPFLDRDKPITPRTAK